MWVCVSAGEQTNALKKHTIKQTHKQTHKPKLPHKQTHTCHAMLGFRFSRMYCVRGESSSSYLSKGSASKEGGSVVCVEKFITGWADLGGWWGRRGCDGGGGMMDVFVEAGGEECRGDRWMRLF